ncbi:MAG: spore coat U domain-containing protein [Anaeromyxobacteraceae bacterium]
MKSKLSLAALAGLVLLASQASAGSINTSMNVTATVVGACTDVKASDVGFGAFSGTAVTAEGTIEVRCSEGTDYLLKISEGQNHVPIVGPGGILGTRNMRLAGGNPFQLLAYQLYQDPAHSTIWGSACVPGRVGCLVSVGARGQVGVASGATQSFTVYGRIFDSGLFNPTPPNGSYADVVNVAVDW